jgi:hypothetical protein
MNVYLRNINTKGQTLFESDKVVSVRVLERKGEKAVVEVNGYKTEANIEAQAPDHFLAFAESALDDSGKRFLRLRILDSFKNSAEFSSFIKDKFLEKLHSFFLENRLFLNENSIRAAMRLYHFGVKLDPVFLKLIALAHSKYGEEFSNVVALFLKNGIKLDAEFLDFFYHLKPIYSKLLEKERKKEIETLDLFSSLFFGEESGFEAYSLNDKSEKISVFKRKEKKENRERYCFDISSPRVGRAWIIINKETDAYEIQVFLNKKFYDEHLDQIVRRKKQLGTKMNSIVQRERVLIEFYPTQRDYLFWETEENLISPEKKTIFNVDISI